MLHLGFDQHKKYSQVHVLDDTGNLIYKGRISNSKEELINLKTLLGKHQFTSVVEASRTWVLFDLLEELDFNPKVANPVKVKAIAEAQIKTDSIDAKTLALLLKSNLIPEVNVPCKGIRNIKNILRHRLGLVKLQTAIKNKIHHIIDRNHLSRNIELSDLFGVNGRKWIAKAKNELIESEKQLLAENLELLDQLVNHVREANKLLKKEMTNNKDLKICMSMPGIGETFGPLIALEIWDIKRFRNKKKLVGYAGLAPTTYSSGGKTYHGKLLWQCNKLLRYAFCEGAWVAIRKSPFFRSFYQRLKERVGAQKAIVGVARKMSEILWFCLTERRYYEERVYQTRNYKNRFIKV